MRSFLLVRSADEITLEDNTVAARAATLAAVNITSFVDIVWLMAIYVIPWYRPVAPAPGIVTDSS